MSRMPLEEYGVNVNNKNILLVTSSYPDKDNVLIQGNFVKNQDDELKKYFKTVYIISPISIHHKFTETGRVCHDYSYDNIHVYFPYSVYLPLLYSRHITIDTRLPMVKHIIKVNNLKIDLIHAHMSEPSGYIAMKLKEVLEIPYVLTIHENEIWFKNEVQMDHKKIINAWKKADALIRVNPYDIPLLKNYNPNSYYIANGYSPTFHPIDCKICREKLGISMDKKILFGLGILTKRKGFHFLIEAMNTIVKEHDNVICYIGGDGSERDHLEKMIHRYNLNDKVYLLGRISDENLPLWMNACDLFVLPSQGEGNPTVMFEALGCGKPFIGTRVGGIPAIISSDEYGLMCEPGSISSLHEVLEKALSAEWDSNKILEYAQQFMWKNICEKIVSIYKKIT